jgi:hypothetical protein
MNDVLDRSRPVKVPGGTSSASLRPRSGDRALDDRAELQVWTGSGAPVVETTESSTGKETATALPAV